MTGILSFNYIIWSYFCWVTSCRRIGKSFSWTTAALRFSLSIIYRLLSTSKVLLNLRESCVLDSVLSLLLLNWNILIYIFININTTNLALKFLLLFLNNLQRCRLRTLSIELNWGLTLQTFLRSDIIYIKFRFTSIRRFLYRS